MTTVLVVTYVTPIVQCGALSSSQSGAAVRRLWSRGAGIFWGCPPLALQVTNSNGRAGKMAHQFTHRQDGTFSHTSICMKCFGVVATRERESELRADEAIHSCNISLPGTKPDPAYWGILCRTCVELVAFSDHPIQNSGPGVENSRPGAIRC